MLSQSNVKKLTPAEYDRHERKYKHITFSEIIKRYGYPLIGKEQAAFIQEYKTTKSEKLRNIRLNGNKYGRGKISKRWLKFIEPTCDICVGDKCCDIMKKNPAKRFEHESGLHPYIGTMTEESAQRQSNWLKFGCNSFDKDRPTSNPLSFWTKSDVLHCLAKYNIPYVKEVYGDIVYEDGVYTTTKQKRTGCIFCGFGCHLEKEPNKFQILAVLEPKLYDYCMRGGKYDESGNWVPDKGLGMAKVLDFINVKWWNDGDEAKRDKYRAKYKKRSKSMRLITTNTATSEYPKRHICENCGAELEYDKADVHVGWMGCEYVTCPNCDDETVVSESRIQPPAWKATFHHTRVETGAVDIPDHEIGVYVNKAAKALCSNEWEPGDSFVTFTGNLLVFGRKWEDGVDIYVSKDYWEDSIAPEDYGMVK